MTWVFEHLCPSVFFLNISVIYIYVCSTCVCRRISTKAVVLYVKAVAECVAATFLFFLLLFVILFNAFFAIFVAVFVFYCRQFSYVFFNSMGKNQLLAIYFLCAVLKIDERLLRWLNSNESHYNFDI